MICFAPNDYLVQAKWFGSHQMIIWFKPNDLVRANDYLVQAKWFGSRQMIIWFKPNDLFRAKWLFGSSQMIWLALNDYLVQAKWFGALQLNTISWNIFFGDFP